MKRTLITIFFLLSIFQTVLGQTVNIDSINTAESVESLIHSLDTRYEEFDLKPVGEFNSRYEANNFCKSISDSLNIVQSFYKADFDNNGLTDILAIGDYYDFSVFIVMDFGNGSLELNRLTRRGFQDCVFPKIKRDNLIDYYYRSESDPITNEKPNLIKKTLIYKFGDFIELNKNPKKYDIEKIDYQTSLCFGSCPEFSLTINRDRKAILNAKNFNRETRESENIKGVFSTTIDEKSYLELVELLNYLNFPELNDNYSVGWTDDQTSTLKITYNNGVVKKIKDYGLIGTYGLDRLYELLFDLRFNQGWKE